MVFVITLGLGLACYAHGELQLTEFSSADSQQHGDDGWMDEMEQDFALEDFRWKAARAADFRQPAEACHTSEEGDACHEKVIWAMQAGIAKTPDWYIPLNTNSSFEDVQLFLHSSAELSHVCPLPCPPQKPAQRLPPLPTGSPPTGIQVDDPLAATVSGSGWSRSSCDCGGFFIEFPGERATLELCAEACLYAV
ncbi:unnamed protein product [Prorocentrum cordatum]|uniref:Uncharacterized protein n=1 Tax=Prorocentrum cordatum TaxID=2364126 RepID=A0ABN9QDU4_9DINO|nr:unnamed protein product [Polarella glacialis]|mmetsp:Transcript_11307/g.30097  ORF Transcript_11307/g.30097 Transcript_11307/m.30097 type:complete len:194 (+) Transcript_11307:99-680(+)